MQYLGERVDYQQCNFCDGGSPPPPTSRPRPWARAAELAGDSLAVQDPYPGPGKGGQALGIEDETSVRSMRELEGNPQPCRPALAGIHRPALRLRPTGCVTWPGQWNSPGSSQHLPTIFACWPEQPETPAPWSRYFWTIGSRHLRKSRRCWTPTSTPTCTWRCSAYLQQVNEMLRKCPMSGPSPTCKLKKPSGLQSGVP